MKKIKWSAEKIISILKENESGVSVSELCRKHGMSDATFYNWRMKYGGMSVSDARRLKDVTLDYIEPGKPTQNAFIESFNATFRQECLDAGLRALLTPEKRPNTGGMIITPKGLAGLLVGKHRLKRIINTLTKSGQNH